MKELKMLQLINIIAILLLLSVGAYYAWQWLINQPQFTVEVVRIEGKKGPLRRVVPEEAMSMVRSVAKGGFFQLNMKEIRDSFRTVPWVQSVAVKREWPWTLVIRLEEYQLLGRWGEQSYLASTGEVFDIQNKVMNEVQLPKFDGPTGTGRAVLEQYQILQKILQPYQLSVMSLQLTDRLSWQMKMSNGMVVELGRNDRQQTLEEKVMRMLRVLVNVQKNTVKTILKVDLRYQNGFALAVK